MAKVTISGTGLVVEREDQVTFTATLDPEVEEYRAVAAGPDGAVLASCTGHTHEWRGEAIACVNRQLNDPA